MKLENNIIYQRGFLDSIKNLIGIILSLFSIFLLFLYPIIKIQDYSSILSKTGFFLKNIPISILLNFIGLFILNLTPSFSIQDNILTTYFLGRKPIKQIHSNQIIKIKEYKLFYKLILDKNLYCDKKYFQIIDFLQIKFGRDKAPYILITKKTGFSPYDFINGIQQELNNQKKIILTVIFIVLFAFLVYFITFLFIFIILKI